MTALAPRPHLGVDMGWNPIDSIVFLSDAHSPQCPRVLRGHGPKCREKAGPRHGHGTVVLRGGLALWEPAACALLSAPETGNWSTCMSIRSLCLLKDCPCHFSSSTLESKKSVTHQQECWCEGQHGFQKWSAGLRTGTNGSVSCELPLAWLTGQSSAGPFQGPRQRWPLSMPLERGPSNWRTSTAGSSGRAPAGADSNSGGSCWQCVVMTAGGHVFLSCVLKNSPRF